MVARKTRRIVRTMQTRTALLVATALAACAPDTGEPSPPDVVLRLPSGDCHAGQDCTFDFGPVDVHAERVRAFDLVNIGGTAASIISIALEGDPELALHVEEPGTLAPGASSPLALSVEPSGATDFSAVLAVRVSSTDQPIRVHFSVAGVFHDIQVTPECNFGDVPVGTTSAPCTVTLSNPGTAPAEVHNIVVDNTVFAVSGALPMPVTIPAGSDLNVDFVAMPASMGMSTGSLAIYREGGASAGVSTLRVNGI